MKNKDVAKLWFEKAGNDLISAEYLMTMKKPPIDVVRYHCQQAAEKYLKGFLAYNDIEPPHIHDVKLLIIECSKIKENFSDILDIGSLLNPYAVIVRYPGETEEISEEDALEAIEISKRIKKIVIKNTKINKNLKDTDYV